MSISSSSRKSSFSSTLDGISDSSSTHSVPDVFLGTTLKGPMVWQGKELDPTEYIVELTPSDIHVIRGAVITFKLSSKEFGEISQESFLLPIELAQKLSAMSEGIHNGPGIQVLRGLDAARFNDEEAIIAFAGISCYVCPNRATDSYANQTLSHVRDATYDHIRAGDEAIGLAGSKIPSKMDFHADRFSGDVLALYVRNDGGVGCGGEQYVSSFWKIYNELLENNPDILQTLIDSHWPFELKGRDGKTYIEEGPAVFIAKSKPMCQLVKAPLLGSPNIPRGEDMPAITVAQAEALVVVEYLANQFKAKLDRRDGDIQFIHNLSIMHARSEYGLNANKSPSSRHLLRMFLKDPDKAWKKPSPWAQRFSDAFAPGREQNLPIIDSDPRRKISGMESHG